MFAKIEENIVSPQHYLALPDITRKVLCVIYREWKHFTDIHLHIEQVSHNTMIHQIQVTMF